MTPALDIRALAIRAGDDPEAMFRLEVPRLVLPAGGCVALCGPSGCGKSTLLEVLALLRPPERADRFLFRPDPAGEVIDLRLAGDRGAALRQEAIGYVPQMGGMLPFLNGHAQIMATLHLAGNAGTPQALARLDRLAGALDLRPHLGKRRAELSGGQRKRVALLTGLALRRALLIADEPTAGLDAANATRVLETLATAARKDGSAVLIATHDVTAARQQGFAILEIDAGRLDRHHPCRYPTVAQNA